MNPVGDGATRDTSETPPPAVPIAGEQRGHMVGPYSLLEILGEGGFGTVWLGHWRLGERNQAREAAAKFRELAAQQRWISDEEVQRWRREVDALILPE